MSVGRPVRRVHSLLEGALISAATDSQIAVLVPCLNEERTVAGVVAGFQAVLPQAVVYVYDNGSTDSTSERAASAGAVVRTEPSVGKGSVVRRMFADVDADIYLMVDGDGTYDPAEASLMVKRLVSDQLDMVVASRIGVTGRAGHAAGNRAFNRLYQWLFGAEFTDILSGYRALSRRFVKSFPAASSGFEIETEISVHASQLRLPVAEIEASYRARPVGSESKLRTFSDGWQILKTMVALLKDNRPLFMFGLLATVSAAAALGLGVPVVVDFARSGLVERLPTAVLATGLAVVGLVQLAVGLILDVVAKGRVEAKRIAYLQSR